MRLCHGDALTRFRIEMMHANTTFVCVYRCARFFAMCGVRLESSIVAHGPLGDAGTMHRYQTSCQS